MTLASYPLCAEISVVEDNPLTFRGYVREVYTIPLTRRPSHARRSASIARLVRHIINYDMGATSAPYIRRPGGPSENVHRPLRPDSLRH